MTNARDFIIDEAEVDTDDEEAIFDEVCVPQSGVFVLGCFEYL